MADSDAQLPVIDLALIKTDRAGLAKKLVDALENVGFLYIDNVKGIDYDMLFKCCKWFFGQPWEVKNRLMRKHWNPDNNNVYRGYFPIVEKEPSRKEGFEFGHNVPPNDPLAIAGKWFYEQAVWPEEDGSFPFRKFLRESYDILHDTSMEILRLTAIGLEIEENALSDLFRDKPGSIFRLLHYPPWEGAPPENAKIEDNKVVTTPDHTDSGFLTLLTAFNYEGLEVMTTDGKWAPVKRRPESLVMNIGDVFSRMMGGRFKATRHRVIDIGVDRYSVPFFLEPPFDCDIGVNFMTKITGHGPEHVPEKYGPWLLQQIKYVKKYFEYKVLPDI